MRLEKKGNIIRNFSELKDPRLERKKLHKLIDIIVIAICAVIGGADGWEDIERFGKAKEKWFRVFLELENGIPSHDTFNRVFSLINAKKFQECFINWIKEISQLSKGEIISIDGKTVRRSYDRWNNKGAVHIVSAWANNNRLVLGQIKVNEKSNEITAIPELLSYLEIEGCIITIDAMGCQKEIASKIQDGKGDYVLALKENHKNLYEDVKLYLEDKRENSDFKEEEYYRSIEKDHGRIEERKYWITTDIDWLENKSKWAGLKSIGMVESTRDIKGNISKEVRFYLCSIEGNVKEFSKAVRSHWGIENSVHWVLDMTFREDESRIRKGHSAENFNVLRHIALNLLKKEKSKGSIRGKRLKAGWDNAFLKKILFASYF